MKITVAFLAGTAVGAGAVLAGIGLWLSSAPEVAS